MSIIKKVAIRLQNINKTIEILEILSTSGAITAELFHERPRTVLVSSFDLIEREVDWPRCFLSPVVVSRSPTERTRHWLGFLLWQWRVMTFCSR